MARIANRAGLPLRQPRGPPARLRRADHARRPRARLGQGRGHAGEAGSNRRQAVRPGRRDRQERRRAVVREVPPRQARRHRDPGRRPRSAHRHGQVAGAGAGRRRLADDRHQPAGAHRAAPRPADRRPQPARCSATRRRCATPRTARPSSSTRATARCSRWRPTRRSTRRSWSTASAPTCGSSSNSKETNKPMLNRAHGGVVRARFDVQVRHHARGTGQGVDHARRGLRRQGRSTSSRAATPASATSTNAGRERLGAVNLQKAITVSSDTYYYRIGDLLWRGRAQYGDAADPGLGQAVRLRSEDRHRPAVGVAGPHRHPRVARRRVREEPEVVGPRRLEGRRQPQRRHRPGPRQRHAAAARQRVRHVRQRRHPLRAADRAAGDAPQVVGRRASST